jgi:hypothetical protein
MEKCRPSSLNQANRKLAQSCSNPLFRASAPQETRGRNMSHRNGDGCKEDQVEQRKKTLLYVLAFITIISSLMLCWVLRRNSWTALERGNTGATAQPTHPHEVNLSWNAPISSPDPVIGYNIYRATGTGGLVLINSSPDTAVTYVDQNVTSGTSYIYEVKSVDSSGVESTASNPLTVTVP